MTNRFRLDVTSFTSCTDQQDFQIDDIYVYNNNYYNQFWHTENKQSILAHIPTAEAFSSVESKSDITSSASVGLPHQRWVSIVHHLGFFLNSFFE